MPPSSFERKRVLADLALFAALAAAACLLLSFNATRRFDFFDMSAFMDAGYRVMIGQAPYADFFYHAGPMHPYLHAFFFKLFGFTKAAILAHLCAGTVVFMAAAFSLARRRRGRAGAAFLTLLSALCFYGPVSHPWYDQNAAMFLAVGLAAFESGRPWDGDRRALAVGLVLGGLSGASFMTKANVGLAGAGVFAAMALAAALSRRKRARLGRFAFGFICGLALSIGALLSTLRSPAAFFYDAFIAFHVTARLGRWTRLGQTLWETPFLMLLVAASLAAARGGRRFVLKQRVTLVTVAGLLLASIFSTWTGSMDVRADMPLLGLAFIYFVRLCESLRLRSARTLAWVAAAILTAFAARMTWNLQAWTWLPSDAQADYALKTKGFEGWRCHGAIGQGVDEAVAYIGRNVPASDSLFVFPDATVIYGMSGRRSYLHAPFIFTYGGSPPPGRLMREFVLDFLAEPPQWIVLHHQTETPLCNTGLLLQAFRLDGVLAYDYRMAWRWGDFEVLRLVAKPPLSLTPVRA